MIKVSLFDKFQSFITHTLLSLFEQHIFKI